MLICEGYGCTETSPIISLNGILNEDRNIKITTIIKNFMKGKIITSNYVYSLSQPTPFSRESNSSNDKDGDDGGVCSSHTERVSGDRSVLYLRNKAL